MQTPTSSSGFNNLTKVLSFNLYDFCMTINSDQRNEYINWIHQKYNSEKIYEISKKICDVIKADVLHTSMKDFDPVGASTLVLMSDIQGGGDQWQKHKIENKSGNNATTVNIHLDKSHITAHTYPDADGPNGICSFRVDIDIATCGEIIPLNAINILFEAFECDLVLIDYVVRGYTRLSDGRKIFNDHHAFNSIQEFIKPEILDQFKLKLDCNMAQLNTWQTKLMIKDFGPERYLLHLKDKNHANVNGKMKTLQAEMEEIYHMMS